MKANRKKIKRGRNIFSNDRRVKCKNCACTIKNSSDCIGRKKDVICTFCYENLLQSGNFRSNE
jgi:hypothetical protein